jgi:hypothetical protein
MLFDQVFDIVPCDKIEGANNILVELVRHPSELTDWYEPHCEYGWYMYLWPLKMPGDEVISEKYGNVIAYHVCSPYEKFLCADYDEAIALKRLTLQSEIDTFAQEIKQHGKRIKFPEIVGLRGSP